jgi:hypothetical protein
MPIKTTGKKSYQPEGSLFPVHCGNPKTISAHPMPIWALPHWINSASRRRGKKKVCADAFWGYGSLT